MSKGGMKKSWEVQYKLLGFTQRTKSHFSGSPSGQHEVTMQPLPLFCTLCQIGEHSIQVFILVTRSYYSNRQAYKIKQHKTFMHIQNAQKKSQQIFSKYCATKFAILYYHFEITRLWKHAQCIIVLGVGWSVWLSIAIICYCSVYICRQNIIRRNIPSPSIVLFNGPPNFWVAETYNWKLT
jgi:hypothetical protein